MSHPVIEPRGYVRGGFGEEMDLACLSITSHFAALPGWQESQLDPPEVVYLAGFFAFIAVLYAALAGYALYRMTRRAAPAGHGQAAFVVPTASPVAQTAAIGGQKGR